MVRLTKDGKPDMRGHHPNSLAALKPVKPGEVRNPAGRPSAGASVKEWFNGLCDTPEGELERIAKDKEEAPKRRAAAIQWLDILAGAVDLADLEAYIEGATKLSDLKATGIAARAIRKVKETRKSGDWGEEVKREVEMSDRGGQALDRIMDRTEGKPHQTQTVTNEISDEAREAMLKLENLTDEEFAVLEKVLALKKTP